MEKILSDTIKLDKKGTGVLMIAHRGLSGLETENTQCAFVAAGNRSYYGIETDVHFTKDGKYVISHDGNLSRVFGKDIEIKDYLYEDLRKVRKIENGDTVEYMAVPTLREYFDVCRRYGKKSVLELKVEYTDEQLKEIIQIAKEEKQFENVIFISFFPDNMIRLRKILPNHPLQLLTGPINSGIMDICESNSLEIDADYMSLNEENIAELKRRGIKINCWIVNDLEHAEKLVSWGVDFITTNILE